MLLSIPFVVLISQMSFAVKNLYWIKLLGKIFLCFILMSVKPLVSASMTAETANLRDIKKHGYRENRTKTKLMDFNFYHFKMNSDFILELDK